MDLPSTDRNFCRSRNLCAKVYHGHYVRISCQEFQRRPVQRPSRRIVQGSRLPKRCFRRICLASFPQRIGLPLAPTSIQLSKSCELCLKRQPIRRDAKKIHIVKHSLAKKLQNSQQRPCVTQLISGHPDFTTVRRPNVGILENGYSLMSNLNYTK